MNQLEKARRKATLEQAIAEGQYRLKSKKNSLGERLSSDALRAIEKAIILAKDELASLHAT